MLRLWDILSTNRTFQLFLYLGFVGVLLRPLIERRWFVWLFDIAAD